MSFWKKHEKAPVNTAAADSSDAGTAADVENVMKKYDRESNTRVWEGVPKQIVRFIMAAFSVYCLGMTLLYRGVAEIPLTLFLAFIIIIGYLNSPFGRAMSVPTTCLGTISSSWWWAALRSSTSPPTRRRSC